MRRFTDSIISANLFSFRLIFNEQKLGANDLCCWWLSGEGEMKNRERKVNSWTARISRKMSICCDVCLHFLSCFGWELNSPKLKCFCEQIICYHKCLPPLFGVRERRLNVKSVHEGLCIIHTKHDVYCCSAYYVTGLHGINMPTVHSHHKSSS